MKSNYFKSVLHLGRNCKVSTHNSFKQSIISKSLVSFHSTASSKVTIDDAKKMPRTYEDLPNELLVPIAILGDQVISCCCSSI